MTSSGVVIEAFTELAPRYEQTMDRELQELWDLGYEQFVNRLTETMSVEDGDTVLDVATGTARIPLALASKTESRGQITGLDITLAMLKHGLMNIEARGVASSIKLVCASAMAMPFVNGTFDLVICGLGMHHMDVSQTLLEMRRVLKETGNLVLVSVGALPSWRSSWRSALMKMLTFLYFRLTHRSPRAWAEVAAFSNIHTADEWRGILSDSGFAEIEISTDFLGRRFGYPNALTMKAAKGG